MTIASPPAAANTATGEAARWQTAAQIRRARPRKWVVIWSALNSEYQARPLFKARPGTVTAAATPEQLTAQMDAIEHAARPRPTRR